MIVWGTPILVEMQDLLERLRIMRPEYLTKIKPSGNNIMFNCPFHGDGQEKKPSCGILTQELHEKGKVYPEGTVHCYTCGYTQKELPIFISDFLGYTDGGLTGYKWLVQNFVSISIETRPPLNLNLDRKTNAINDIKYITEEELSKLRFTHPYMYKRKLNDKIINYFDVGFSKEENCLTFPVHDINGNVPFIYKRSVKSKFFINEENTPRGDHLYGLYEAYKNVNKVDELWICESPIDALTAWTHKKACVASFTTSISEIQLNLLKAFPKRKLVIATDGDFAGNLAANKIYKALKSNKLIYRLYQPEGVKDMNDMEQEHWENLNIKIYTNG